MVSNFSPKVESFIIDLEVIGKNKQKTNALTHAPPGTRHMAFGKGLLHSYLVKLII